MILINVMYLLNLVILVILVNFVILVILAIYGQQLENICQLNVYIGIGYIPATIGEYTSVGYILHFLEYTFDWINTANNWGIYTI